MKPLNRRVLTLEKKLTKPVQELILVCNEIQLTDTQQQQKIDAEKRGQSVKFINIVKAEQLGLGYNHSR